MFELQMKNLQVCKGYSVGNMLPLFILSMGYPFREGPTVTSLLTQLFCQHIWHEFTGEWIRKSRRTHFLVKIHILLRGPMAMHICLSNRYLLGNIFKNWVKLGQKLTKFCSSYCNANFVSNYLFLLILCMKLGG